MIAVQLYTLRDHLKDPSHIGGVLARLREIGYRVVEVAGLGPAAHGRFGVELASAEMIACAVHVSLERLVADLGGVAAESREWGCGYVVVPSLLDEYRSLEGYRRFAGEAAELSAGLQPYGLQLAYHNHSHELERYGEQTGLEALFAAASAGALQFELDTYWLQFGGANPAAVIRRFAGRVPLVHLKDMAVRRARARPRWGKATWTGRASCTRVTRRPQSGWSWNRTSPTATRWRAPRSATPNC